MKKIRTNKKGFTLAELLIVVAIIGVLVGISIPIFTAQLEKSKKATNEANARAAKAAAVSDFLGKGLTTETTYAYDVANGTIAIDASATTADASSPADQVADTIAVTITPGTNGASPTVTVSKPDTLLWN